MVDHALRNVGEPTGTCQGRYIHMRDGLVVGRGSRLKRLSIGVSEDGVDSLVGDVFFVVEGSDVGGDEGFDAVSESACGFGEWHSRA